MRGRLRRTCALALAGVIVCTGMAQAKTFEVTKRSDPVPDACKRNDCSLREAVMRANARPGPDKVVLPGRGKPYRLTIAGDTSDDGRDGDLDVSNDRLAIVHPGKGKAKIRGVGLDDRIFDVFAGAPLRLSKVNVSGGALLPFNGNGGAIRAGDRVTVNRSVIANNTSNEGAGAIDTDSPLTIKRSVIARNRAMDGQGGALNVTETAPLRISDSVFRGNETTVTGGAIRNADGPVRIVRSHFTANDADEEGGAIRNAGTGDILIDRSVFSGNSTGSIGGALELNDGEVTIRRTTISGNRAESDGGGMTVAGTALSVVNSTIANNRSNAFGGGIRSEGPSDISLNAVSVVRNVADADQIGLAPVAGGGLYREEATSFEVRNSLIALNRQGPNAFRQDCAGDPFDSLGDNLRSETESCLGFGGPGDLVRQNPKIGRLKDNGGPTRTVALKKGSAAINKAHKPSSPNRDQRGVKRKNPDIGAFERR